MPLYCSEEKLNYQFVILQFSIYCLHSCSKGSMGTEFLMVQGSNIIFLTRNMKYAMYPHLYCFSKPVIFMLGTFSCGFKTAQCLFCLPYIGGPQPSCGFWVKQFIVQLQYEIVCSCILCTNTTLIFCMSLTVEIKITECFFPDSKVVIRVEIIDSNPRWLCYLSAYVSSFP